MPNWTNNPPDDPRGFGLPIVRTPAARELIAIVTSEKLIGCDTHFWGGHTLPCTRPNCPADEAGIAYRWHGYLTAYNPLDQVHFVFEMTAQAAAKFVEYHKTNDSLRGCQFTAWRWARRKNGRVMLKLEQSSVPAAMLPNAPDVTKIMAIIWRLPIPNVEIRGLQRGVNRIAASSDSDGQSSDPKLYPQPQP